jgi:hypothetical protein
VALLGAPAFAETDIEQADKLFAEGLALRDTNLQQSCDKFRQSFELNPQAIGTLMNVALCDERFGRIASAVAHFSEARDRAKEGNLPEYLAEAQKHIDALTPELPYVTIQFAEKAPGTRVLLGDRVVPDSELGGSIAVDPGELVVVVSAPGRVSYETKIVLGKREKKPIAVPALRKAVTVQKSSRRTIGLITAGTGAAAIATGVVLGLVARNKYRDAFDSGCQEVPDGQDVCSAEAQGETESAITIGTTGTVIGVIGIAAVGVGAYLWWTAPSERNERKVSVVPTLSPDAAGLTAIGRF